jgi:hypothetical protein
MARPGATSTTPKTMAVVADSLKVIILSAIAVTPIAINMLMPSDPVSLAASFFSRSASAGLTSPSSTSLVMSRTIFMAPS